MAIRCNRAGMGQPERGRLPGSIAPHREGRRLALCVFSTGAIITKDGEEQAEVVSGDAADLSLLRQDAPLLVEHAPYIDSLIGRTLEAWIEAGEAHAIVEFSSVRPLATELHDFLMEGGPLAVSAGMDIMETAQNAENIFEILRWRPWELSVCVRGADEKARFKPRRSLATIAQQLEARREVREAIEQSHRVHALQGDAWRQWASEAGAHAVAEALGLDHAGISGILAEAVGAHIAELEAKL